MKNHKEPPQESEQDDKWRPDSGHAVPPGQERQREATRPEPHTGLQGESGACALLLALLAAYRGDRE